MSDFGFRIVGGAATRIDVTDALAGAADLIWVHLAANDAQAEAWLRDEAGLPEYVVEALIAAETRPRCEAFEDGALVNLRGRSHEEMTSSDPLASVRIWAVRGRVFSVTRKPLVAVGEVERAVEAGEVHDPGDLITAFATAITTDLDPIVADLGDEVDECEERLGQVDVFALRRTVARVRSQAIGYRRFLYPQRAALEKLATLPGDWLGDDDRSHLSAAADRAARMAEELDAIRDRSALTHEQLTDLRAEQLDSRSLIIAIAAMVFLPLTFLTGLYGMNVAGLPGAQSPWAFDAILAGCAAIAIAIAAFFTWRHWLR